MPNPLSDKKGLLGPVAKLALESKPGLWTEQGKQEEKHRPRGYLGQLGKRLDYREFKFAGTQLFARYSHKALVYTSFIVM